jgi:heme/copper-type cytochrome/quinol oxidase subunit 2
VPLVGIGDNAIPLIGIEGYAFWSLVDLAIVLFGIVIAVWSIFAYRRRRDDSELAAANESSDNSKSLFTAIIVLTIANAALFLLSQDFTAAPMVMVDIWTIPNTALFIAECVLGRIVSKRARVAYDASEETVNAIDVRNA